MVWDERETTFKLNEFENRTEFSAVSRLYIQVKHNTNLYIYKMSGKGVIFFLEATTIF